MTILALLVLAISATLIGMRFLRVRNEYVANQRAAFTGANRNGATGGRDAAMDDASMTWSALDDYQLRRLLDGSAS